MRLDFLEGETVRMQKEMLDEEPAKGGREGRSDGWKSSESNSELVGED